MSDGNSTPAAVPSALEAGVQIGDFRIERRLGAGGMGIVYQARQLSLNRPVALKVLGQALTRSADVSRFQREAQAAARLKHPGIAQVYFIGQDRHLCYLAMELIGGVSLRRVLDRLETTTASATSFDLVVREDLAEEPAAAAVRFDLATEEISPPGDAKAPQAAAEAVNPYLSPEARDLRTTTSHIRRVCEIIRDAALAFAHAHEQGVVHRDIKPDNLLLDREGKVHVIDFGVARFFEDQSVTYTGQLVGTPLYMSPEQVTGRGTIDARSDIYSLGLVLYELLTLRPSIKATNRENLLRTIVTKPLAPVSWRNKAVPSELERIVHRATQKDPDQRYATAVELAADLDRFLAGKPVAAPAYHFRLDEREIIAARPGRVVVAAFAFFVCSVFIFIACGSFGLFFGTMMLMPDAKGLSTPWAVMLAIAVTPLVPGLAVGWGLLSGRGWAWWLGVAISALVALASIGVGVLLTYAAIEIQKLDPQKFQKEAQEVNERANRSPDAEVSKDSQPPQVLSPNYAMYAGLTIFVMPIVAGLVLGSTALCALLSSVTRRWFRFAREIRAEHLRLKEQLAE
jgi:serine/threonine protein kinase